MWVILGCGRGSLTSVGHGGTRGLLIAETWRRMQRGWNGSEGRELRLSCDVLVDGGVATVK